MSKKSLYIILLFLALGVGSIVVWRFIRHKPPPPTQPLRVGIATWPGYAPGFIAKEKGFFGDLPVDFTVLDDFTIRQNAFTSGQNQATISSLDTFAFESGQGVKGKVILILDESFGADGIVVSSKIKTPQDLKGKKVAYTRGSPSHFFLIQFLKKNGMSMSDISRVEVDDPGRAGEAFVSGSVDVAVTWEPNISQIVNSGKGRILESTKTSPGLIVDIMVVSPELYNQRKEDVQKFVDGWLRAVEFIKTNQAEAYSIMARGVKIPEADFPQTAAGIRFADLVRNRELLLPANESRAIQIFNEAARIWVEEKLVQTPQNGASLIAADFINKQK